MKHALLRCCAPLSLLFVLAACGGGGETSSESAPAATSAPLTVEERLAQPPNIKRGQRQFGACAVCHERTDGAPHRVGPNLWAIFDQPAARFTDFAYSPALRDSGIVWDEENLDKYLEKPTALVPGGRMAYPGEADAANRRDMIAYLKTLQ